MSEVIAKEKLTCEICGKGGFSGSLGLSMHNIRTHSNKHRRWNSNGTSPKRIKNMINVTDDATPQSVIDRVRSILIEANGEPKHVKDIASTFINKGWSKLNMPNLARSIGNNILSSKSKYKDLVKVAPATYVVNVAKKSSKNNIVNQDLSETTLPETTLNINTEIQHLNTENQRLNTKNQQLQELCLMMNKMLMSFVLNQ